MGVPLYPISQAAGAYKIPKAGADGKIAIGFIPDLAAVYQPLDGDLTALAALSSTGFAQRTGANTWSVGALTASDIPSLAASKITSGQLALARGGTAADLSATGGSNQFVKQSSAGAALSVGAILSADLTSALTTPPPIGGTTPAAGTFTSLTANASSVLFKNTEHGTAGITFTNVNPDGRTRIHNSLQSVGITFWHAFGVVEVDSGSEFRINGTAFAPNLPLAGSSSGGNDVRLLALRTSTGADQTLRLVTQRYGVDGGQPYLQIVSRMLSFWTRSSVNATTTGVLKTLEMAEAGDWTFLTAVDVQAALRCDSLRIDTTPTAETITPTHTITVSINGTNYKIPMVAA